MCLAIGGHTGIWRANSTLAFLDLLPGVGDLRACRLKDEQPIFELMSGIPRFDAHVERSPKFSGKCGLPW